MNRYSSDTITKLKDYRKKGYSILTLVKEFSMPKTSIWHHIHGIKLSKKYRAQLKANQGGSKLKKERDLKRANEEANYYVENHDSLVYAAIAMLYWAEGSKGRCEFVNTDGEMIGLYLRIIRNYLKVPESRIQAILRIFSNHNRKESLKYWSNITNIPENNIKIIFNDGGVSGRTPYGMCRIVILKGGYLLKLFKALAGKYSQIIK